MDDIFPISTPMDDSAPNSMIHNYIFRVSLLQPVHRTRPDYVISNSSMICVLLVVYWGFRLYFAVFFCNDRRIFCSLRCLFIGI